MMGNKSNINNPSQFKIFTFKESVVREEGPSSSNTSPVDLNDHLNPKSVNSKDHLVVDKEEKKKPRSRKSYESVIRVSKLLAQLFKGEEFDYNNGQYKPQEIRLIETVIKIIFKNVLKKKKRKKKVQKEVTEIHQLTEGKRFSQLSELYLKNNAILVKRKEENLKFILKNVLKILRKKYFDNYKLKSSRDSELSFLNFYFEKHMKIYNYDIEDFSDPLSNTVIKNKMFNSLSNKYFKTIFSVESFRTAFIRKMEEKLIETYNEKIQNKLRKFFKPLKLKLEVSSEDQHERLIEDFINKLENQKLCKLPWLKIEMENAMLVFKNHLQRVLNTN